MNYKVTYKHHLKTSKGSTVHIHVHLYTTKVFLQQHFTTATVWRTFPFYVVVDCCANWQLTSHMPDLLTARSQAAPFRRH